MTMRRSRRPARTGPEGASAAPTIWQELTDPAEMSKQHHVPLHVIWGLLLEPHAPEPEVNGEWLLGETYDYLTDRIKQLDDHQPRYRWWSLH